MKNYVVKSQCHPSAMFLHWGSPIQLTQKTPWEGMNPRAKNRTMNELLERGRGELDVDADRAVLFVAVIPELSGYLVSSGDRNVVS
jgi:hypothetical protein